VHLSDLYVKLSSAHGYGQDKFNAGSLSRKSRYILYVKKHCSVCGYFFVAVSWRAR